MVVLVSALIFAVFARIGGIALFHLLFPLRSVVK